MAPLVNVLSLHVPLLPTTRNMITLPLLKTIGRTAILTNVAHGGVVNEEDLRTALRENVIAFAGWTP
ncbi:uncharacterized protein F4817DRAFT_348014, partial [Daldinia loculata]|uniref:uncharacterized protein n=1 Tax=Daldinia loculata TaxID=103429 RepID=UPI0020C3AA8C